MGKLTRPVAALLAAMLTFTLALTISLGGVFIAR